MVDFLCIVLIELRGTQSKREFQNEEFLPTLGLEPITFRLLFRRDIHCDRDLINQTGLKVNYIHDYIGIRGPVRLFDRVYIDI